MAEGQGWRPCTLHPPLLEDIILQLKKQVILFLGQEGGKKTFMTIKIIEGFTIPIAVNGIGKVYFELW